ncbi:MAG: flagellar protein FlaG [Pseudomonas sp.]|uniref:flagellar protein FlaG n=1 Tax=Pseudomonas sp. TaxID=306 RepID=UPI00299D49C4|nr:flagellar protein FlaG [Pseudomonas sp.]MDX1723034.1 flagellar protein FlaG [Pseudomonas sp.]
MDIAVGNALPVAAPKGRTDPLVAVVEAPVAEQARAPVLAPVDAEGRADRESLEQAVSSIKDFVQAIRRDLNFSLDDSSGRIVIKVTDSASGDVIRQMPTEEALRLAESLDEVRSLLFKAEA